jgi:hypothetical protein
MYLHFNTEGFVGKAPITSIKANSNSSHLRTTIYHPLPLRTAKTSRFRACFTSCKPNGEVMNVTVTNGRSKGQK